MANLKDQSGLVVKNIDESKLSYFIKIMLMKKEKFLIDNVLKILKVPIDYISKNSGALSTRGPTQRVPFLETDKEKLFQVCEINKAELLAEAKKSGLIGVGQKSGKDFEVMGDPFNLLCSALVAFYYKHDKLFKYKSKEDYKYYNILSLYLTIRFYTSIYIRQFQHDPDSTIMDYTIENLSNKYLIKKCNNIFELNKIWAETNIENMEANLLRFADIDIIYYTTNLNTRISQNMIGISHEFYNNHKNNKRYNVENTMREDEEGEMYVGDVKNISGDIEVLSRKILIRFASDSIIDMRLLDAACAKKQVSKAKMAVIINKIRDSDDKLLQELIKSIIAYFLQTTKLDVHTVKSNKFIVTMIKVYTISNTKNEFKIKIADVLDEILKKHSAEYLKTSREATLSSMRSALYYYIVLYIAKNSE